MQDRPEVSVITPLYNSEKYISDTIRSVINQEYSDWEYIIVNDSSTDRGPKIAGQFAESDSRIRIINLGENKGAGVSRNTGIEAARGRYIAFLDSDDQWLPGKLRVQLEFMKNHQTPFSFTDYHRISEDGEPIGTAIKSPRRLSYRKQLKTNYVGCSTAVYDSNFYGKRYFPEIRKRQDFALWLDLLGDGNHGLGIPEPLTIYRVRKTGLSGKKLELIKHNWRLYRDVLGCSPMVSAYYLCWNIIIKITGAR